MTDPSIGRDVHYVSRGSADGVFPAVCRAAKVTEVGEDGRVGLAVTNPDGMYFHPLTKDGGIAYFDRHNPPEGVVFEGDAPGAPGTWHWPENSPTNTYNFHFSGGLDPDMVRAVIQKEAEHGLARRRGCAGPGADENRPTETRPGEG